MHDFSDCPGCTSPDLAFAAHDHALCARDALARAEALVEASGARLTPVRRRVLEILLEDHRALGAYDVLARLAQDGFGNQPPVAYRALDFLVDQGLAHRIQRLNAFTACVHPGEDHAPAFLICRACHSVAEAAAAPARAAVETEAARAGFRVERLTLEALGLCPACQGDAA
ncbi:MAG: Fur family transcriptional regulator [Tabrizicola sp.]